MSHSKNKKYNPKKLALAGSVLLTLILFIFWWKSRIVIVDKYNLLMRSSSSNYNTRSLDSIQQIVVHHSASIGQTAEDYARYHVQSKGWPGLGYHFVIEIDGTIVQGNPLTNISYNTENQNTKTVGICLSGDFTKQEPTAAQLDSLKKLIKHLRTLLKKELPIFGHKDYGTTSCPGTNLYKHLAQL